MVWEHIYISLQQGKQLESQHIILDHIFHKVQEQEYIVNIIMTWIQKEMKNHSESLE